MSNEVEDQDWKIEALQEAWIQDNSPMSELPIVKVYNKPMWGWVEDVTKAWKIIIKRNGWEFEVLGEEIRVNILLVRKFYTGFAPRIANEFWDIAKDDNWHVIKDFYYTPEVDIFNKSNIPLWVQYKWGKRIIIGKSTKTDFDLYSKSPKINWELNPLFKEVKTNQETWERFTTSYMKLWYVIYAQDLDTSVVYKIIPGWSYWRFNDVKDYTFEHLKIKAKEKFIENPDFKNSKSILDNFIKAKIWVRVDWGFTYLKWELDWIIEEDNREIVEEIRLLVEDFNKSRFEWLNFDTPLECLPYTETKLLLDSSIQESVQGNNATEISIEDVPF
jgi:hypothetical protein